MIGYVKSNNTKKIQKLHHHLQKIGATLDIDLSGDMSTAIAFYFNYYDNYDLVDYRDWWKEDPDFKRIKIKDVMKTESWEDVVRLIDKCY